eukprot:375263-Amorphochlora_amoeboformis.AAC.1
MRRVSSLTKILRAYDKAAGQCLWYLCDKEHDGLSDGEFRKVYDSKFVTMLSNATPKTLIPGGQDIQVTARNRLQFVLESLRARLFESKRQMSWLRNGFSEVFPLSLLSVMLTYNDVEKMVAGDQTITTDRLKAICQSHVSKKIENWFWEIFESFNQEERQAFLMFSWSLSMRHSWISFLYIIYAYII